jgi:hypothetical protein
MIHTINDRITWFTDVASLRRGAFRVIDAIQQEENKAVQFLAPGVAFCAMADALGRFPHDDISRIRRMMGALEGPYTEQVQAIRDYAKGELLNVYG